jgi:pimeloyl-ACP methyl ester carboxylesterase
VESVRVGDLVVAFERVGNGSPVVFLHGGMSDHREWRRQIDALSDAFTVIAWDAPGCGVSSDPPDTFRMRQYGETLAAFLDAIGVRDASVVGSSWGAALALELYHQRRDVVRTLVLAAPYAGWAGSLSPAEVAARVAGVEAQLDRPASGWVGAFLETLLTGDAPAGVADELLEIMSDARAAGIRPMLHAMAEADLRDVLPTVAVPTLLLAGERDVRSGTSVVEPMHDAIASSRLVVLRGAGHQMNLEASDAFDDAVRRFLAETT